MKCRQTVLDFNLLEVDYRPSPLGHGRLSSHKSKLFSSKVKTVTADALLRIVKKTA